MKRIKTLLFGVIAMLGVSGQAGEVDLRSARITVVNPANRNQEIAAEELEKHLLLIAGERKPSKDGFEFVIGRVAPKGTAAKAWESHAMVDGGALYFWGDDGELSENRGRGSVLAVFGFLDELLGVKWVRPGDEGILYTQKTRVNIPDDWKYRFYPPLERSDIRIYAAPKKKNMNRGFEKDDITPKELKPTLKALQDAYWDARVWQWRMRLLTRATYGYGHAFMKWNDRFYGTTNQHFMAMWTGKQRGHHIKDRGKWIHLCHSNPGVHDQIIRDWCDAGTNRYLNICATDSSTTHCRCEGCRALDADKPGEDFLNHKSDRQVWLWNQLAKKAIKIRPDVKIIAYSYTNYRYPPRRWRIEYPDNMIVGVVPSLYDDSNKIIQGWKDMGMKEYFVRPNYLCSRVALPRGLERYFFEDFKANAKLGMIGVDHDNWRRFGSMAVMFEFYALARVIANPDLTFDEMERDYLSQFGTAAGDMKEYYSRVRRRGEAARAAQDGNLLVMKALDDGELALLGYKAHGMADLNGDIAIIDKALARTDLTDLERKRIREVKLVVEHGMLTMDFINKGYSKDAGAAFLKAADRLLEFRLRHGSVDNDMREEWRRFFYDGRSERPLWNRIKEMRAVPAKSEAEQPKVSAAQPKPKAHADGAPFIVQCDNPGASYRCGDEAVFTVRSSLTSGVAKVRLDNFGDSVLSEFEVDLSKQREFMVKGSRDIPGFLLLTVRCGKYTKRWGAVFSKELITGGDERPTDFEKFWRDAIACYDRDVKEDVKLELLPSISSKKCNVYMLSLSDPRGRTVYGFLKLPKDLSKGPFPVRVSVAGAGPSISSISTEKASMVNLLMNVHYYRPIPGAARRGPEHTALQKKEDEYYSKLYPLLQKRYTCTGIAASREEYFYYGAILAINRAVNWLKRRPEVKPDDFTYYSNSQGGGIGLALAALNGGFRKVAVAVPALTAHLCHKIDGRQSGWPNLVKSQLPENVAAAERNAPYFDGVHFASLITCPIRFSVGFTDTVAPPHAGYAAFNACPSKDKAIFESIGFGHSTSKAETSKISQWLNER